MPNLLAKGETLLSAHKEAVGGELITITRGEISIQITATVFEEKTIDETSGQYIKSGRITVKCDVVDLMFDGESAEPANGWLIARTQMAPSSRYQVMPGQGNQDVFDYLPSRQRVVIYASQIAR